MRLGHIVEFPRVEFTDVAGVHDARCYDPRLLEVVGPLRGIEVNLVVERDPHSDAQRRREEHAQHQQHDHRAAEEFRC